VSEHQETITQVLKRAVASFDKMDAYGKKLDDHRITLGVLLNDLRARGEVIAVGPGGRDEAGKIIPIDLKVGDRVLFGKWPGTEVRLDGVEYLIMKESDIMGVIEQTAARKKAA
jgi:co-chaperonin GroES (HSP10)